MTERRPLPIGKRRELINREVQMRKSLKLASIATIIFGLFYLMTTEYFKAQAREHADNNQKLDKAIFAQREWNERNVKRIKIKSRMIAILSNFGDSMHHDPSQMAEMILTKCEQRRLDPFLVLGMIKAESDFNSWAVSNQGAMGLMQIKPETASHLVPYGDFSAEKSGRLLSDNELNISLGTLYLAKLIHRFGNLELALEAYNKGPEGMLRDLSDGSYEDEPTYAGKVIHHYHKYKYGPLTPKIPGSGLPS